MEKRSNQYKKQSILRLLIILGAVILVNIIFSGYFMRFDLTKEKRYTISSATKSILKDIDDVIYIQVFLEGDLPADYRRLRNSLQYMLDEYRIHSGRKIEYTFVDPFKMATVEETNEFIRMLLEKGFEVRQVAQQSMDEISHKKVIPGALILFGDKEVVVNLLPDQNLGENTENVISSGISTMEYTLSSGIRRIVQPRKKKVAFLQGHGELPIPYISDLAFTLQHMQYDLDFIDLPKQAGISPLVDVLIIAKPTLPFSENDKFKIDQYIMNGGKVLWCVDMLNANLDSLYRPESQQTMLTMELPLNLDDQLFTYGVRINDDLVQDLSSARIPLYSGNSNQPTFFPWLYFPVIFPQGNHPIVKHLDPVIINFASSIDTVRVPDVEKTILLSTSNASRTMLNPVRIGLQQATIRPLPEQYTKSDIPVAVLLEGEFKSVFRNRVQQDFLDIYRDSFNLEFKEQSVQTKMIVISDGDFIRNEIGPNNARYKLGQYRFNPNYLYANKNFILNSIDYLTDNYGLVATRTKEFKTRPLDKTRLKDEAFSWQMMNLGLPVLFILIFAAIYGFIRKRKYSS